ncbi:predicted protein [Sclerotinia sclerotiorum 1980 UF-70]|uniref:Uncharacterized protein n=1 Tax=Sclerotinia sclerotiorum (strain ATCC 18683 / 1980 / Ss-1) TaxID=665079 RepID=A7F188_SCLS1|nr:predicted protein [Sclerotinia sclerotiorum 1980 UF-70]EDN95480.1 predicted protein [Sclerotinia sclerotiorum 1980 UF-70]
MLSCACCASAFETWHLSITSCCDVSSRPGAKAVDYGNTNKTSKVGDFPRLCNRP